MRSLRLKLTISGHSNCHLGTGLGVFGSGHNLSWLLVSLALTAALTQPYTPLLPGSAAAALPSIPWNPLPFITSYLWALVFARESVPCAYEKQVQEQTENFLSPAQVVRGAADQGAELSLSRG